MTACDRQAAGTGAVPASGATRGCDGGPKSWLTAGGKWRAASEGQQEESY